MRIACLGGGPGGLVFSILAAKALPGSTVEVWDRNPPGATYGFGVVFSDEAMDAIRRADERVHEEIVRRRAHWGEIDVHVKGRVYTSGGHGFSALSRSALVTLMQERATDLGVRIHYETDAPDTGELADYDVVVAADGVNSTVRARHADVFRPTVETGDC